MSKNVPPIGRTDYTTQSLTQQGVAADIEGNRREPATLRNVPFCPQISKNVPPVCTPLFRIEAIGFGAYYCAAYRRHGAPDVLLDDADGKPQRFASATAAIKAAELALHFKPAVMIEEDDLGAGRFHEVRAAAAAALEIETLGGVVVDGRVVPVEVRKR